MTLVPKRYLVSIFTILILVASSIASPINFLFTAYAQNDADYGSGEASSDGSLDGNVTIDDTQNTLDQNLDGTTNNEITNDFNQPGTKEPSNNNEVIENQPTATNDANNFQTEGTQNLNPIAKAGPDLEVDEKSNVVLDGTASTDQDGNISGYSWA